MLGFLRPSKRNAQQALREGLQSGDLRRAIRQFRRLASRTPEDHELVHDLGVALLETGEFVEAVTCFERANEMVESAVHWNNLGRAKMGIGEFGPAAGAFVRARTLDPEDPQPWYNLTICQRLSGKAQQAFSELAKFVVVHPDHAAAHSDLALHHEERGDNRAAICHLETALKAASDYSIARLNLVRLLCDEGRRDQATPHLERLAEDCAQVEIDDRAGRILISPPGQAPHQIEFDPDPARRQPIG